MIDCEKLFHCMLLSTLLTHYAARCRKALEGNLESVLANKKSYVSYQQSLGVNPVTRNTLELATQGLGAPILSGISPAWGIAYDSGSLLFSVRTSVSRSVGLAGWL